MAEIEVRQSQQASAQAVGQSTSGGVSVVESKPKNIFANMTREQAEKFGLLDEFKKANTDGDEVISDSEYSTYVQNQPQKSVSGKRTAVGGVYSVQSGDTLSAIANDFGIDIDVIYKNNIDTIGKNKNKIFVGQQLKISKSLIMESKEVQDKRKEEAKQNFQNKLLNLNIPDGMKKVISKEIGINFEAMSNEEIAKVLKSMKLSDLSKILNTALTQCDKEDLIEFKKQLSISSDEDKTVMRAAIIQLADSKGAEKIFQTIATTMGIDIEACKNLSMQDLIEKIKEQPKEVRISLMKAIGNSSLDSQIFLPNMNEESTQEEIFRYYGIEDLNSIPKEERAKKLAEAIVNKKNADLDENNESSLYNQYLIQLRKGLFTEYELKDLKVLGISPDSVPEDKLKEMAKERVYTGYIKAFNNVNIDLIFNQQDLQTFITHMRAISGSGVVAEAHQAGVDTSSVSTTIAMAMEDDSLSQEEKQEISNILVENSSGLGVQYLEDDLFAAVSTAIYNNSDQEHSTQYSNDYKDRSDVLKEVLEYIMNTTTDQSKKTSLQEVYSVVSTNSINNSNQIGLKPTGNGAAVNGMSNPIAQTRQESLRYYEERGISYNTDSDETAQTRIAKQSVRRISLEMTQPKNIIYTADKILKISGNIANAITSYSTLSEEDKNIIKDYLKGASSQPNNIVTFMLQGGKEIEQFMIREKIIPMDVLINSIRPDDFDKFTDFIKSITSNEVAKSVKAGTLKPEQMTASQMKMYEYYEAKNA